MKQKTLSQFREDLNYASRESKLVQENLRLLKPLLAKEEFEILKSVLLEDRFPLDLVPNTIDILVENFNKFAIVRESLDLYYEDVLSQVETELPDPLASVDEVTLNVGENEVLVKNVHGKVVVSANGKRYAVPGNVVDQEALAQVIINFLEDFEEQETEPVEIPEPVKEATEDEETEKTYWCDRCKEEHPIKNPYKGMSWAGAIAKHAWTDKHKGWNPEADLKEAAKDETEEDFVEVDPTPEPEAEPAPEETPAPEAEPEPTDAEVPAADAEPEDESEKEVDIDRDIETTTDETKKQKLQVLKNIIDVKLIRKYANDQTERNRIVNTLKNFILKGEDEQYIKSEVQQQAVIDFFLDMIDILLTNKRIANLVAVNASAPMGESKIETVEEFEQVLTEAKKAPKEGKFTGKRANSKKKKAPIDRVTPKLEMLLRLGLVEKSMFQRARRALTAKKEYGSIPMYRNLMLDLLDDIIEYIQADPTLYNRMRINVMKEMKASYLPSKRLVVDAYEAGKLHLGSEDEIPEEYNHYFAKEAFLRGMSEGCGKKTKLKEASDKTESFGRKKDIEIEPTKPQYKKAGYKLLYKFVHGGDRYWYDTYLFQNGDEIIEVVDDALVDNISQNPDKEFRLKLMDDAGRVEISKLFDQYLDKYYGIKEAWSIGRMVRNTAGTAAKKAVDAAGDQAETLGKNIKDPVLSGAGKTLKGLIQSFKDKE